MTSGDDEAGPLPHGRGGGEARLAYGMQGSPVPRKVTAVHQTQTGPLPPVEAFSGYDKVRPGTANDIVSMARAGHEAEIDRSKTALRYTFLLNLWGRILGAAFALVGVIGGIVLVYLGHDAAGGTIATTALGGVAIALITGRPEKPQKSA